MREAALVGLASPMKSCCFHLFCLRPYDLDLGRIWIWIFNAIFITRSSTRIFEVGQNTCSPIDATRSSTVPFPLQASPGWEMATDRHNRGASSPSNLFKLSGWGSSRLRANGSYISLWVCFPFFPGEIFHAVFGRSPEQDPTRRNNVVSAGAAANEYYPLMMSGSINKGEGGGKVTEKEKEGR